MKYYLKYRKDWIVSCVILIIVILGITLLLGSSFLKNGGLSKEFFEELLEEGLFTLVYFILLLLMFVWIPVFFIIKCVKHYKYSYVYFDENSIHINLVGFDKGKLDAPLNEIKFITKQANILIIYKNTKILIRLVKNPLEFCAALIDQQNIIKNKNIEQN